MARYNIPLDMIHSTASSRASDFLNGKKTMDANRLIAALCEHVQRLEKEVEELKTRNELY